MCLALEVGRATWRRYRSWRQVLWVKDELERFCQPGPWDGHYLVYGALNGGGGGLEGLRFILMRGNYVWFGQAPDLRLAFKHITLVSVEESLGQEKMG